MDVRVMSTHRCASQTHSPVTMFYARGHFAPFFFCDFSVFPVSIPPACCHFVFVFPYLDSCSFQFNGDIHFFLFAANVVSGQHTHVPFSSTFLLALFSVDFWPSWISLFILLRSCTVAGSIQVHGHFRFHSLTSRMRVVHGTVCRILFPFLFLLFAGIRL